MPHSINRESSKLSATFLNENIYFIGIVSTLSVQKYYRYENKLY